jgi:hypothetical protein
MAATFTVLIWYFTEGYLKGGVTMPEMKFLTEERITHWPEHLVAVMLYPNDEYKRKEFLAVLTAKNYLPTIQSCQIPPNVHKLKPKPCGCFKWEDWSQRLLEIAVILADAPPYEKIFNKTVQNRGMLAGEVLYWTAITENSGLGGSAAKTEHLLDEYSPITITGEKLKCSERTTRAAWKEFMPVAHLHSALRSYSALYGKDRSPWDRPDRFLQVSEFFRRFGESFCPGNQRKSILDASKTWKPPKDFPLKEINIPLAELNESGRAEVANYLHLLRLSKESRQP